MFHVKQKGGESLLFAPAPAEGAPDWRDGETCQLCTRRRKSVCQRAHARTSSARRTDYLRMLCAAPPAEDTPEWWNGGTCCRRTRSRKSIFQSTNARTGQSNW